MTDTRVSPSGRLVRMRSRLLVWSAVFPIAVLAPPPSASMTAGGGAQAPSIFRVPIHEIQGTGSASTYVDSIVLTIGVVTATRSNGFFLQTPDDRSDRNAETSEGLFVFTTRVPAAASVGNLVMVGGTVVEFVPSADPGSPPLTELINPTVLLLATGQPLPAPIALNAEDLSPSGSLEALERLEGMRVRVDELTVVSGTGGSVQETSARSTSNGVFYGVIRGVPRPMRSPGLLVSDPLPEGSPCCIPRFDGNPERLRVDSDAQIGAAAIEVEAGAVVGGLVGPLDFAFRTYTILPDPGSTRRIVDPPPLPAAPAPLGGEFTVATLNAQRFFDAADDPSLREPIMTPAAFGARLVKLSRLIRERLHSPDVIGLQEIESLDALRAIADAVNANAAAEGRSSPNYQAFLVEGLDPGGIDVGVLVNRARVAAPTVAQAGRDDTFVNPLTGAADTLNDRPPLVVDTAVTLPGAAPFPVTVIVNHLRSLSGILQEEGARVRAKRRAQAEFLARLVQSRQSADPRVRLIVLGDLNAFEFSDGLVDVVGTIRGAPAPADEVLLPSPDLVQPDLVDLGGALPPEQRYSFVFDGTAQALDHVLVSASLAPHVARFAYVRTNADFPESYRNDPDRVERLSDHDAAIGYFTIAQAAAARTSR